MTAKAAWKRPPRGRVRAVRDRVRRYYGRPRSEPHHAPLDELVLTVLSQNTNDRNRDVAYVRLRARFPDWGAVAAAPVEEIEEAIRPGGISRVKSLRIKSMLEVIEAETGGLDLGFLADAPRAAAIEFLERLPGVGRKTAACVLMFAFDRPEIPVDTHVYRVCTRLGLLRPKASFEEAHEVMREATDPGDAFELHVNLIRHGRRICSARNPGLPRMPAARCMPLRKARDRAGAVSTRAARLRVRVQPRAAANEIAGARDGVLLVRVTAPPADGRANDAVRKLIARRLRVGVTRVEVVRGASARDKVLQISDFSDEEAHTALGL